MAKAIKWINVAQNQLKTSCCTWAAAKDTTIRTYIDNKSRQTNCAKYQKWNKNKKPHKTVANC